MKRYIILVSSVICCFLSNAYSLTITASGTEVTVEYDEPTETDVDDDSKILPIDDLSQTNVFCDWGVGSQEVLKKIASSVNGGAHVNEKFTIPLFGKRQRIISCFANAMDITGNVSPNSNTDTERYDTLPPAAPR